MHQPVDLCSRVTRLRTEAFDLIRELSRTADGDDADPLATLALVRMQAVANNLGRIQGDLQSSAFEQARVRDL